MLRGRKSGSGGLLVAVTVISVLALITLLAVRILSTRVKSTPSEEKAQETVSEAKPDDIVVETQTGDEVQPESLQPETEVETVLPEAEDDEEDTDRLTDIKEQADEILAGMSLEDKIFQMMILMPEQLTGVDSVSASGDTTRRSLEKYPVGGIMYNTGNLKDPKQTKGMLSDVQEMARDIEGLPLFLCVDEEGGRVARVGNIDAFDTKDIPDMSKIKSASEAYEAGKTIGEYLSDLGFNVDFAPVADVLSNPDNTVIGNRSFGNDKDTVKEFARQYSDGLHMSDILSTYKHFPGHGATAGDTHDGFSYTDKTLDELKENELVPFADAKDAGADFVMVSHISVPKITGDYTPCSLSYKMITEVLKDDLGFDGLVITDGMNMGAITNSYGGIEAAVLAIKAGNDILLAPKDFASIPAAVKEEINKGNITEERIDDSARKIIIKKLEM